MRAAYDAAYARSPIRDTDRFYRLLARRAASALSAARRGAPLALDVGCGGGYWLRELLLALPDGRATAVGLEVSRVALAIARDAAPGARLLLAQGETAPFPDDTFDIVACLGNLEHFLDPAAGVREISRVLRPEGLAWILLPNSYYSGDIWRVLTTGYGPNHHQIIDRFATLNEWRDLLEAHGLRVEGVEPYNRFKWWKRLLPRAFAYHFLFRARKA